MSFDAVSLRRMPDALEPRRQRGLLFATVFAIVTVTVIVGKPDAIPPTLFNATTIVIAAVAVALPLQAGFLNVGVEGQMLAGGLAAAAVGGAIDENWPLPIALSLCILAAITGGIFMILPAWALQRYFRVPEVISTILLNFAAQAATNYFTIKIWAQEGTYTDRTPELPSNVQLGALPWPPVNLSILIAVLVAVGYWALLRSHAMLSVRAAGANAAAAELAGRRPERMRFIATITGGAIAGLASCNQVLGYLHGFKDNFAAGVGFTAIIVAVLAPAFPAIVFVSLLLGGVQYGLIYLQGMGASSEMGNLIQAVVLIGCLLYLRRRQ